MKTLKTRMILLIAALAAFGLVGCNSEPIVVTKRLKDCKEDTSKARAEFILSCIANANPGSDEEPEDWLRICQYMAEETLCKTRVYEVTRVKRAGFWYEEKRRLVAAD